MSTVMELEIQSSGRRYSFAVGVLALARQAGLTDPEYVDVLLDLARSSNGRLMAEVWRNETTEVPGA